MFKLTYISTETDYPYIFEYETFDNVLMAVATLALAKDCYKIIVLDVSKDKRYFWKRNKCGDIDCVGVDKPGT